MKPSRTKSLRVHARGRARERYGMEYGAPTRRRIIAEIRAGRSTPKWQTSNRVVVHDVSVGERVVRVAYDKRHKEIVTFLPRGPR